MVKPGFSVMFDKGVGKFKPGETVSGKCFLDSVGMDKTEGLEIHAIGQGYVHWKVASASESGQHASLSAGIRDRVIFVHNIIFNSGGRHTLKAGRNEFPFSFDLPLGCPCPFKGAHGSVTYEIKSAIHRPVFHYAEHYNIPFEVDSALDLNSIPGALFPVNEASEYFLGCCCCKSGPISLDLTVNHACYAPGEYIHVHTQVTNRSKRIVRKRQLSLEQSVTYIAQKDTRTDYLRIAEFCTYVNIPPGHSDVWDGNFLQVPLTAAPTNLGGNCRVIQVSHTVRLTVKTGGVAKHKETLAVPVTIGTWIPSDTPSGVFRDELKYDSLSPTTLLSERTGNNLPLNTRRSTFVIQVSKVPR